MQAKWNRQTKGNKVGLYTLVVGGRSQVDFPRERSSLKIENQLLHSRWDQDHRTYTATHVNSSAAVGCDFNVKGVLCEVGRFSEVMRRWRLERLKIKPMEDFYMKNVLPFS